jgi:hypothetical protein
LRPAGAGIKRRLRHPVGQHRRQRPAKLRGNNPLKGERDRAARYTQRSGDCPVCGAALVLEAQGLSYRSVVRNCAIAPNTCVFPPAGDTANASHFRSWADIKNLHNATSARKSHRRGPRRMLTRVRHSPVCCSRAARALFVAPSAPAFTQRAGVAGAAQTASTGRQGRTILRSRAEFLRHAHADGPKVALGSSPAVPSRPRERPEAERRAHCCASRQRSLN